MNTKNVLIGIGVGAGLLGLYWYSKPASERVGANDLVLVAPFGDVLALLPPAQRTEGSSTQIRMRVLDAHPSGSPTEVLARVEDPRFPQTLQPVPVPRNRITGFA